MTEESNPDGMLTAKGKNGQLEFEGGWLTIHRKGAIARVGVGKGTKRIPAAQISSVQIKPAGGLVNGYIQFSFSGGNERRSQFGKQTMAAARDENSVIFTKQHQGEFEAIRSAIEDAINDIHSPTGSAGLASAADEIAKLAALRDSGALSDEEFEAHKAKLL